MCHRLTDPLLVVPPYKSSLADLFSTLLVLPLHLLPSVQPRKVFTARASSSHCCRQQVMRALLLTLVPFYVLPQNICFWFDMPVYSAFKEPCTLPYLRFPPLQEPCLSRAADEDAGCLDPFQCTASKQSVRMLWFYITVVVCQSLSASMVLPTP